MSVKLLKTTTDGAVSQKSNEIHLKLNDCQLNRYFVDTSGLLATWPEFWAIGLSFLGLNSWFCVFHYLASSPTVGPGAGGPMGSRAISEGSHVAIRLVWWVYWWFIYKTYMPVYNWSRFFLNGRRVGPLEVVQEVLADLKSLTQESKRKWELELRKWRFLWR